MTIRDSFVEHFGEEDASRIEEASIGHQNDDKMNHGNDRWGKDLFQYHLLMCISHDCFGMFHDWHGIAVDRNALKAWVLEHAHLHDYDGDIPDYIGLMAGAYTPWINWEQAGETPPENPGKFDEDVEKWRALSPNEKVEAMRELANQALAMLAHHQQEKGPSND